MSLRHMLLLCHGCTYTMNVFYVNEALVQGGGVVCEDWSLRPYMSWSLAWFELLSPPTLMGGILTVQGLCVPLLLSGPLPLTSHWLLSCLAWCHGHWNPICVFGVVHAETRLYRSYLKPSPTGGLKPFKKKIKCYVLHYFSDYKRNIQCQSGCDKVGIWLAVLTSNFSALLEDQPNIFFLLKVILAYNATVLHFPKRIARTAQVQHTMDLSKPGKD